VRLLLIGIISLALGRNYVLQEENVSGDVGPHRAGAKSTVRGWQVTLALQPQARRSSSVARARQLATSGHELA
jgi:hypothetical protein